MYGKIIKGIGSFYTVLSEVEETICKARGRFRKDRIKPVIGDEVQFIRDPSGDGFIEEILPRKNVLIRPPLANLDLLFLTVASALPQPDLLLIDRLLVQARIMNIDCALIINKTDLNPEAVDIIKAQYLEDEIPVLPVCAKNGDGIDDIISVLGSRTAALAGQSGVGKSSIMNALCPAWELDTGNLSRIEHGKHTTRRVELFSVPQGGYLIGTPGFSLLEFEMMDPDTLKNFYTAYMKREADCRFQGCNHLREPDCAVLEAVRSGELSAEKHARYELLYNEIKEKWGKRYD